MPSTAKDSYLTNYLWLEKGSQNEGKTFAKKKEDGENVDGRNLQCGFGGVVE